MRVIASAVLVLFFGRWLITADASLPKILIAWVCLTGSVVLLVADTLRLCRQWRDERAEQAAFAARWSRQHRDTHTWRQHRTDAERDEGDDGDMGHSGGSERDKDK